MHSKLQAIAAAILSIVSLAECKPRRPGSLAAFDPTASASVGYAYQQHHGLPVSFVRYIGAHSQPTYPVTVAYSGVQELGRPQAPYYSLYANALSAESEAGASDEKEVSSYEQRLEEDSSSGERGSQQSYGDQRDVEELENENHEAEHEEGEYKEEAGQKTGEEHSGSEYEAREQESSGQRGGSHGNESYHKKGERTSGYHKVYRKDDYKKDTTFYDEEHVGGEYERYGSADARHKETQATRKEAASHESGQQGRESGRAGSSDRGREHTEHREHEAGQAGDSYSRDRQEYHRDADRRGLAGEY